MVTSNVIQRTFHIRYNKSIATCFAIDIDNRQYLVTAKHVVTDITTGSNIEILINGRWNNHTIVLIGHHPTADISVISIPLVFNLQRLEIQGNFYLSEDVYFLGFPYGLAYEIGAVNNNNPLPIIKKAIISGVINENKVPSVLLLDGMNNPGFSGGPVVNRLGSTYKVISVISGYRYEEHTSQIPNTSVDITYRTNTGIIITYDIRHARYLIDRNPNGTIIQL